MNELTDIAGQMIADNPIKALLLLVAITILLTDAKRTITKLINR